MKSVFTKIAVSFIPLALFISSYSSVSSALNVGFSDDVTYAANLTQFNIDANSGLPQNLRAGYIQLRTAGSKGTLALTLFRAFYCPPGVFCTMMMPAPVTIQVALSSFQTNSCGVRSYQGQLDYRTTDGSLIKMTLVDNTHNQCPTFVALNPTEVVYETQNPHTGLNSHSVMFGNKLEIQEQVQIQ